MQKVNFRRVYIHSLSWISLILAFSSLIYFTSNEDENDIIELVVQGLISFGLVIIPPIYFNTLFLIPKYFIKKRYLPYSLWLFFGCLMVWPPVAIILSNLLEQLILNTPEERLENPLHPAAFFIMFFLVGFSTLINLSYRWYSQQGKLKMAESEKLNMELSFLRNQINPHFFFNTLNNLYALSEDNSKETSGLILKLSDIMRYTIYDCTEDFVPVKDEVAYLENYIALQTIRLVDQSVVQFSYDLLRMDAQIAPLILVVFVENGFKHGIESSSENSFLHVHLKTDDSGIEFKVENRFSPNHTNVKEGGLGLINVRRRLNLIYKDRHDLQITKNKDVYSVYLKIEL